MNTFNRRSFFKVAGAATGAAAVTASPALAAAMPTMETSPTSPLPSESLIAIVRDGGRGEITILSGKTEKTYRDRILVQRIMKAARSNQRKGMA